MKFFTYKIINRVTNKSYYGWTNKDPINKRLAVHFHSAKIGKLLLHNSIRKHGEESFDIELINSFTTKELAIADEIRLIAEGKTNHCRYPNGGYNMTDGGEGVSGYVRTEEAKQKTADKNRGKLSPKKGKTYEEIYGAQAAAERAKRGTLGVVPSTTTRKKQSKAKQGNKNGCFPVRVTYDDGSVKVFPSQTDALEFLNIKSRTTLRSIATGLRYKSGKYEKYNSPYNFTIELLRHKI